MSLDLAIATDTVDEVWDTAILPALHDYIAIPNVSPAFDPGWAEAGHMDQAVELARRWCKSRPISHMTVEVVRLEGRTPVLLVEVPPAGTSSVADHDPHDTVLLYGHLDKQPPMEGWREGLGPWSPVLVDGRLYGRGGADDGYAVFAALTALDAVRSAGGAHSRAVVLIECSEESGSPDLPAYVDHLADRIGTPSLVVCLDSGCATYDRLWVTTSLRGNLIGELRVDVLTEGVHSGGAGGIVPSSFRVLRRLLGRVEDDATGHILLPELHSDIPEERMEAIKSTAPELASSLERFPWAGTTTSPDPSPEQRMVASTWEPCLAVTGMDGIPPGSRAGNVLRPFTAATLSFRLPPTVDAAVAAEALVQTFEADPPHGAEVHFTVSSAESGWDAPPTASWLSDAVDAASTAAFGLPARAMGEGGTIPFMGMLGKRFPDAQFLVTGVLGPESNAHGPNEFLDVATARRITTCLATVLDAHARR
jgi:acetylornithine deacetylase/succinyl-diaminopimelate desuccinylase-like protein